MSENNPININPDLVRTPDITQIGNTDHIKLYKSNIAKNNFSKMLEVEMEYPAIILDGAFPRTSLKVFFDLVDIKGDGDSLYLKINEDLVCVGKLEMNPENFFKIKSIVGDVTIYHAQSDEEMIELDMEGLLAQQPIK